MTTNATANENILAIRLEQLIAVLSKPIRQIPADKVLWDAEDIGNYLKVSARHVAERIACRPEFPKAIYLPTAGGVHANRRWRAAEIIKWTESKQA